MQKIPIKLAQNGMILAREVFQPGSSASVPICGKGVVLTEAIIDRMIRLEVQTVCVEGHPVTLPDELPLEEELANCERRFRKIGHEPRMIRIKEMFKSRLVHSRKHDI